MNNKTVKQLQQQAKSLGIVGYSRLVKGELIKTINKHLLNNIIMRNKNSKPFYKK